MNEPGAIPCGDCGAAVRGRPDQRLGYVYFEGTCYPCNACGRHNVACIENVGDDDTGEATFYYEGTCSCPPDRALPLTPEEPKP